MKQCKNCRTVNDDNSSFCVKCGSADLTQIDDKNAKKKKIKKAVLICVGVFIGINILLFAIAMFVPSSDDGTNSSSSSSKSMWVNNGSELVDGSGLYYYYNEKPQNFAKKINTSYEKIIKICNIDASNYDIDFEIVDTMENPNNIITYTCAQNSGSLLGYYLDCNDDGIVQIRTTVAIQAIAETTNVDVDMLVYGYSGILISTALLACDAIDESDVDRLYTDLVQNLSDNKITFYINGIAIRGSFDESSKTLQFTIIKLDKSEYKDLNLDAVELNY